MKKAIIYDFDKTIYSRETSISFMLFYIKKHPKKILPFFLSILKIGYKILKKEELKQIKNTFFECLEKNIKDEINEFWNRQEKYFFPYFFKEIEKNKKEAEQLILISASPDFLLNEIYKKLGFDILIATKYENYKLIGNNCKGVEKLNRLNEIGKFKVLSFYSDSMSDKVLFDIAEKKFSIDKKGQMHSGYPKKNGVIDKWK